MNSIIGTYINDDTFVHRLDPRIKLVANIGYIVATFVAIHFTTLFYLFVPLVILYIIGTKNVVGVFKLLKMPLIIGCIIFFINLYTMKITDETRDIYRVWWYIFGSQTYALSWGVVARTLSLIIRIYIMIMATTLFVSTTKPILLTKALEDLMLPLKILFIPTHIIAMVISVALRFIPTLLIETKRIMKAQASRGVDFKNGRIKDKVKAFTTLIIPLFSTSFAKAEDLSNAMETRGYDPYAKRTRYRKLVPTWRDAIVSIVLVGLLVITYLFKYDVFKIANSGNWIELTSFKNF